MIMYRTLLFASVTALLAACGKSTSEVPAAAPPPAPIADGPLAAIPESFRGTWFSKELSRDCTLTDDDVSIIISAGQAGEVYTYKGDVFHNSYEGASMSAGVMTVLNTKYEALSTTQILVGGKLFVKDNRPACDAAYVRK
jgi:hypothetical protein